jgi:hypothetical protein
MNSRTEERLRHLAEPSLMQNDATYYAQVAMFRRWLVATEGAMDDEGISADVQDRVLNRLVWVHPDGAGAHVRLEHTAEAIAHMRQCPMPGSMHQVAFMDRGRTTSRGGG